MDDLEQNMLTKQEKLEKRKKFLHSDEFGEDVYISLFTFRHNALGFLTTIKFYDNLIGKVEDTSIFKHNFENQQIIEVKQRIFLDIITKAINISEGLFILVKSLNEGYSFLAKNMVKYRSTSVRSTIKNIRENKLNLQKILAFPDIQKLSLSNDEKKFLEIVSSDTISKISNQLNDLCDFYEKYNIIYNKTKHGMTIYPTGFLSGKPKTLENSSLTALDHKEEKEHMPKGYFVAQIEKIEKRWFNAKAHLNFNKKFLSELAKILNILEYLTDYIISNHFTFVNNCGEGYIPFKQLGNGKAGMWFNSKKMIDSQNEEIIISIQNKLFVNLLGSPFSFKLKDDFSDPLLSKIIPENSITNIWLQDEPLEKR